MDFFKELGDRTDRVWRLRDYDEACFPDVALQVLAERPPAQHVDARDLLQNFLLYPAVPHQPRSDFGQPPLVVYRNRHFYVEVLYWMESTTSLHQHSFSGAFHLLAGASLQGVYRFEPQQRITSRLHTGTVHMESVELLRRGDTRPIHAGRRLIHSLFHLEQPSATVVVRTHTERDQHPQYTYARPRVAFDTNLDDDVERALQAFELLGRLDPAAWVHTMKQWIQHRDLTSVFHVLHHAATFNASQFDRLCDDAEFLVLARARHGVRFEPLLESCRLQRWLTQVIDARIETTDPNHRYLLALLLNVPQRDEILRLVSQWEEGDAVTTVMRWLRQMATIDDEDVIRLPGFQAGPAPEAFSGRLHVVIYGLFRELLTGESADWRKVFPAEVLDLHRDYIEDIRTRLSSSAFQPLLHGAPVPAHR